MPSFSYPQHLLHKTTEPHWFPRLREETESSLDALEVQEEQYLGFLRSISHKESPDPIGVSTAPSGQPSTAANSSAQQPAAPQRAWLPSDVDDAIGSAPTSIPRFWNQSRTTGSTTISTSVGASPAVAATHPSTSGGASMLESPLPPMYRG